MARRNVQAAPRPPANSQSSTSDVEGDDSQRVLALSSLLQTPKTNHKELQDFKARVAHDQKQLKALLEHRMWQAEAASTRRRNELTKAILDALQTPNRPVHRTPRTLGDTKIARNAVFKSVADVLTASEHLVGEYDQLDQLIVGIGDAEQEGVADAWAADIEKTDRLLKVGAESAIRNVKKVLGADIEADDVEDVREEAIEKMEAIENMKLNYELHTSLLCAERGVRKIVKSLSLEEGQ